MQYTVNRGEKGKIEVKVDLPKAGFDEAYEQVLTKLGGETSVAGFRPGKAPREVLIQHVGSNKVLNQTASFLISKHLSDIFKKENLIPIDSPNIAVNSLEVSAPFSFVATFTQRPTVKVGNWKAIKVKKIAAKEITDADIGESIKNIFETWRKQKETEGTEGTKGKEDTEEKEEQGKFIYDSHGNKIFVGDEKGAENKKIESFKIDDDFAKAIGARDLAHLRELVKRDLETIVADQVETKLEQDLFEKILKLVTIEVPEILVNDELNRILVRMTTELERQGRDLDKYFEENKTTIDELKAKWRPQAEKNVKVTLVMDEIGKNERIIVTPEEVESAMKGVSEQNLTSDQKEDLERYLALSIFQAKTLDLVKKTITS